MNELEINTSSLNGIITSLEVDIGKYELNVENFFKEIEKVSDSWNGPDADAFITRVLNDKKMFDALKIILDDYANLLKGIKENTENYSYFQG